MFEKSRQRSFLPLTRIERLVPNLRDSESPGRVKVYRATPDGKCGELIRVEIPREPTHHKNNNRYFHRREK